MKNKIFALKLYPDVSMKWPWRSPGVVRFMLWGPSKGFFRASRNQRTAVGHRVIFCSPVPASLKQKVWSLLDLTSGMRCTYYLHWILKLWKMNGQISLSDYTFLEPKICSSISLRTSKGFNARTDEIFHRQIQENTNSDN